MGKGSRNRQLHQQDRVENPEKYKKKKVQKPLPKWVTPLICIVLLVAIIGGVATNIVVKYGLIQNSRIVVESKTGKFDVTQKVATYVAWKNLYYEASMYWLYCKYGIYEDTQGITKSESEGGYSQEQYALAIAQYSLEYTLRDAIDGTVDALIEWVAVCDAAKKAGIKLDAEDKKIVNESIESLTTTATNYGYASLNAFLSVAMGKGMRESDIRKAEEMSALYNKYCTKMQVDFEKNLSLEEVISFRDAHPENYYKLDYLMYSAATKDLADKYAAATDAESFKELILLDHFEENYKTAFNKYTTQVTATADYDSIKGVTDANGGTALSDKLNAMEGMSDLTTYNSTDETNEDLKKWLFSTARKHQESALIVSDDVIYLAVFLAPEANATSVQARVKTYEFDSGENYDGHTDFKAQLKQHLQNTKVTEPDYPELAEIYKESSAKAKVLLDELKAITDNAAKKAAIEKYNPKKVEEMTNTTEADKIPEAVRDEVIAKDPKAGEVFQADAGTTSYVIYTINADTENEIFDVYYVTYEADVYYKILDDLSTSLAKVYPTEKNTNPIPDAEADTFEAWISEHNADNATISLRKENDTKVFEVKTTDETTKVESTSYNVYMVVNTPMYLDKTITVNGGHLLFSGKDGVVNAEAAKAGLVGKTYAELLNALESTENTSSPTISTAITEDSISDTNLKNWLFSDERQPNDVAVVNAASGSTSAYLAVYIGKGETWKNTAASDLVNDKVTNWIADLTKDYSASEKVLNKIGKPTPETTATTAATTAAPAQS